MEGTANDQGQESNIENIKRIVDDILRLSKLIDERNTSFYEKYVKIDPEAGVRLEESLSQSYSDDEMKILEGKSKKYLEDRSEEIKELDRLSHQLSAKVEELKQIPK